MKTGTRLIPLTQGQFAVVDAVDYDWLSQWNWCVLKEQTQQGLKFYAKRGSIEGTILMHVEIAKRTGLHQHKGCDHRDGNGLNNTRSNIRPSTPSQNCANRTKIAGTSSRYKGVTLHKGRWVARIKVRGKSQNLGSFAIESDAGEAYRAAALRTFGEYACLVQRL